MTLAEDAFVTVIKLLANNPSSPPTRKYWLQYVLHFLRVVDSDGT